MVKKGLHKWHSIIIFLFFSFIHSTSHLPTHIHSNSKRFKLKRLTAKNNYERHQFHSISCRNTLNHSTIIQFAHTLIEHEKSSSIVPQDFFFCPYKIIRPCFYIHIGRLRLSTIKYLTQRDFYYTTATIDSWIN